ncbi:MAG: glycosyltransferase [Lachnospiraceae bacterium]|nr:glycosyltransferase [Lachnospiraceae bacterium]
MSNNPKVSIMFPSYNHGEFVAEAIQSVLNQTFDDYEVIFSDDASTDNTMEIVKKYADDRFVINQFTSNQGANINTKYIYSKCKGRYLALCNSDDVWMPEHLEKGVDYLDSHPECGAVFSWAETIDENGRTIEKCCDAFRKENRTKEEWVKYLFMNGNCLCHPSVVIRKSVYEEIGFYNLGMRQLPDFYLWTKLVKKYEIHIFTETLVKHRRHINTLINTSAPIAENSIRDINESIYILRNYFRDMEDDFFCKAFNKEFRNNKAKTHEELLCEKFFLLYDDKYYMKEVGKQVAHSFFLEICDVPKVYDLLVDCYKFNLRDFYEFGSTIDLYDIRGKNEKISNKKSMFESTFGKLLRYFK